MLFLIGFLVILVLSLYIAWTVCRLLPWGRCKL